MNRIYVDLFNLYLINLAVLADMFTGIIEDLGTVVSKEEQGTNITFRIESALSPELKVDQSVSHNGVCLTVVEAEGNFHAVTAVHETLEKSNLDSLVEGSKVNLERAMLNNGRFDGHIVQGHVDGVATVKTITQADGSWLFTFAMELLDPSLIVEKGSVCINGVSLTCFDIQSKSFSIAIIPYTFEHTTFGNLHVNDPVNIEYDILGKYVQRQLSRNS
jgi:riboflavin synthase